VSRNIPKQIALRRPAIASLLHVMAVSQHEWIMERARSNGHRAEHELGLGVCSPAMQEALDRASQVASFDSTVLIVGESGVGKERLAKFIHKASPRAGREFVAVNCGAIVEGLFESELFGHARGAFTGALLDRPGVFEEAHGGTLLLDEIGEIPLPMQVKLLRVLQERQVRRVGGNGLRPVDVRVIAATNRDLVEEVAEGRFRRDLFYRLRVVEIVVPPLRERPEDVRTLAHTLLERVAHRMGRPISGYTPAALETIMRYQWPGNVRELENAVEFACVVSVDDVIDVNDLPKDVRGHLDLIAKPEEEVRPLRDVERDHILSVLKRNHGSKTLTAQQLGIGAATLRRKLNSYKKLADRPNLRAHIFDALAQSSSESQKS
jgi:two-component system response regulator HydG